MEDIKDPQVLISTSAVKKEKTFEAQISEMHCLKQVETFSHIKKEGELTDHNQLYIPSEAIKEGVKFDVDSQNYNVKIETEYIVNVNNSMCGDMLKGGKTDEIMFMKSENTCENDTHDHCSDKSKSALLSEFSNPMVRNPLPLNTKEEVKLVIKGNLFTGPLSEPVSKEEKVEVISREFKTDHITNQERQRRSTRGMKSSHYHTVHEKRKNRVTCDMCRKTFSSRMSLVTHIKSHTKEEYTCEMCKKCFTSKGYIYAHMVQVHSNTQYVCKLCFMTCNNLSSYRSHLLVHRGDVYICDICSRSFALKFCLYKHMFSHFPNREDKKTCICNICCKLFSTSSNLNKHIVVVHNGVKFSCDICQKSYSKKEKLGRHMQNHTSEFLCNKCHNSFSRLDHLKRHNLEMHDDTCFLCDMCHKSYMRLDILKRHILLIHNDNRFLCDICKNSCKNKKTLINHKQKHLLGIQCQICKKPYTNKVSLNAHIKKYH